MTNGKLALLPNRGVISVTGDDAGKLLQGLITNDMDRLTDRGALHAGLLSPQGKILFDFFVVKTENGLLLDTGRHAAPDLAKRLTLYKLRADATIEDVSAKYTVAATWGADVSVPAASTGAIVYADPRLPGLGSRMLVTLTSDWLPNELGFDVATEPEYAAHRIALGVPEAGADFELGDTFVHEALYDQLGGVSFKKGCFVGQEVVSRMQHRGTARKRIVQVKADSALPETGSDITAGTAVIGKLGSVDGNSGLALIRIDRAAEALSKNDPVCAGQTPIRIEIPPWAMFKLRAPPADPAADASPGPAQS